MAPVRGQQTMKNAVLEILEALTRIQLGAYCQAVQDQQAVALKLKRPAIGPPWQSMARQETCL